METHRGHRVPGPSEASSFGKYTLVAKLATGGMAEIFLARLLSDGGFEKLVCIKRILPHLAKDPQFVAMFLDEARVVARISHPNVCQVFELGEISGQYYIAMEYLAGVPLAAFRRKDYYPAPPDAQLVAGFGVQACEGLHHAHQLKGPTGEQLGVVHRDISPQNLFVTLDGIVKVLDFGIAKVQDQSVKTSTGAVKGTYCYMAPEQLRGELVDRRADVWALGTVLWETLAQKHLFKRETEFLTFQAITTEPIPGICELRPDVPPALGAVLTKALSRDREDRFSTARALGEALAQAVLPLGGAMGAAAIADKIEASFSSFMDEQRALLDRARSGDIFDLERSNPMGAASTKLSTTPVSNIKGKLEAAQAEVAQYVSRRSEPLEAVTVAPPRRASAPMAVPAYAVHKSSKLPWVIAIVAVIAATFIGAMKTESSAPAAQASPASPSDAAPAVAMIVVDAGVAVIALAPDAAIVQVAAQVVAPPPIRPKPQPRKEPEVTGPPGFITIDSSPVYATIFIDGKNVGETPLVHISVAPGKHAVRAVSPSGTTRSLAIAIESGKTAPVRRIEW